MASRRQMGHWLVGALLAALVAGCTCDDGSQVVRKMKMRMKGSGQVELPDAGGASSDGTTAHLLGSEVACPALTCDLTVGGEDSVTLQALAHQGWTLERLACGTRCTAEGSRFLCDLLNGPSEVVEGVELIGCELSFVRPPLTVVATAVAVDGPTFLALGGGADGGTAPYTYAWDGGPGVAISHANHARPDAFANASGVHGTVTFTLTAADAESHQASASTSVTVP